jgi:hypothetical protein
MLSEQDITDLKIILKEQREYIDLLDIENSKRNIGLIEDILDCNKVMVEIVEGPKGGISKLL